MLDTHTHTHTMPHVTSLIVFIGYLFKLALRTNWFFTQHTLKKLFFSAAISKNKFFVEFHIILIYLFDQLLCLCFRCRAFDKVKNSFEFFISFIKYLSLTHLSHKLKGCSKQLFIKNTTNTVKTLKEILNLRFKLYKVKERNKEIPRSFPRILTSTPNRF